MKAASGAPPPNQQEREYHMSKENSLVHRTLAALGATAMSLAIMVSYFAAPQVQAVSGMLA